MELALAGPEVITVDPDGKKHVFEGCTGLADIVVIDNDLGDSGW